MSAKVKVTTINIKLDYLVCYGELLEDISNTDIFNFIRNDLGSKKVYLHIVKSVLNNVPEYTNIEFTNGKREDDNVEAKQIYNMCTYVDKKIKRNTAIIIPVKTYQKALNYLKIIYESQLFNTFSILEKEEYNEDDDENDYEDDYIFYYSKPLLYNISHEDSEWNIMGCFLNNFDEYSSL
jgi:predicted Zn-dependent protease